MGDGSARRSLKGPGGLHPDAEAFDAEVEAALRAGGRRRARGAGPGPGRRPARRRARAVAGAGRRGRGGRWQGSVTWAGSPYGVTYLVATWTAAG